MFSMRILVTFIVLMFDFRTLKRIFSPKMSSSVSMVEIFSALAITLCAFYVTKNVIFMALLCAFCSTWALKIKKQKRKSHKMSDEIQILDGLIMQMRAGFSFENALREVKSNFQSTSDAKIAKDNQDLLSTNGQHPLLNDIFLRCSENASQSFKILSFYRNFLRVQDQLDRKYKTVTLQARAQAWICCLLFLLVFSAQWMMFPNFGRFLQQTTGRLALSGAVFLLLTGLKVILNMSKPGEIEL